MTQKKYSSIAAKTSSMVILVAMIMILSFTACQPNDGFGAVAFTIAYAESFEASEIPFDSSFITSSQEIDKDIAVKIGSTQDLMELSSKKAYPFFDSSSEYYNSDLSKKVRTYNTSYFEDKEIILVFDFENSYSLSQVDKIDVKDNVLTVRLARPIGEFDTPAVLTTFVYIIEVNKQDVKDISEVKFEIIEKGTEAEYRKS